MTGIKHWLKTNLDLVANVLLSIGAFVILCGWRALDFTNINLVMTSSQKFFAHLIPAAHLPAGKEYLRHVAMASGDKTCAYLSNMVYRYEPFSWDIFRIHSLNPPDGMAGVSTGLAPLWSLFFKFLGVFGFDPYWQTEGLFTLVSFVLIGVAATYIFRHVFRERQDRWLISIASLFFIFAPVMMNRVFIHTTLVMHWVFLFAFTLYLDNRLTCREWILGAILLMLSIGIFPYFLPMTCVPLGALALKQLSEKSISPRVFLQGAIFWSAIIAVMALLLLPLDDVQTMVQRWGYGYASMNLNALFNPIWSRSNIIPAPLGQGPGNYDGDNYLGFGLLVLFVMLIPAIRAHSKPGHRWFLAGCGLLLLLALSCKIQFYDFTIFEYTPRITRRIGETFRGSGRLFWPCWYFLAYFLIWLLFQTKGDKAKYILVALAALQLYDLYPTIRQTRENIEQWSKIPYQSDFRSDTWNALFEKYRNVFIVGNTDENRKIYQDLWYVIPTRKIQVNDGHFPERPQSLQKTKAEENLLKSGVISSRLPENTIFIFISRSLAESYLRHAPSLSGHVKELDGIYYLLWNKNLVEGNNLGGLTLNWKACELNVTSAVVEVNPESCEVTSLAKVPGSFTYVTYGPYIYLPQGQYSFAIEYTGTSFASAADVGAWDIALNYNATVLGKGVLPSTNGNRGTFRGVFTLPSRHTRDLFEIRTLARPDAKVTIHGLEIKRID